jgi:hypothetical protein
MVFDMKNMNEVRSRLEELSKTAFNSVNDMAAKTGVEQKSLFRFLQPGSTAGLSLSTFFKILEYFGGRISFPGDERPQVCDMGDYAMVPKVRAKLGAGSSLVTDGEQEGLYAFRKDFLRRIGLDGNGDLALFDVIGDSMDPTIQHMDTVLVSRRETDPVSGQIYAIRVDDELLVKRILKEPGKLVVKSDNPDYGTFEINIAEPSGSVEIIGRVRWQGRVY